LDGYWVVRSSLLDATELELLAHYRGLWRIEDAFKVSNTSRGARPVHVWSPQQIEAHFAVCFLALLVGRLIERCVGLPLSQVQELMGRFTAIGAAKGVYLVGRPAEWAAVDQALGVDTDRKWVTIAGLREWRRQIAAKFRHRPLPT
jgi:hypothetical protein